MKIEMEIEIEDFDNLRKLQREFFTQNRRMTRNPIYLVQSRVELPCAEDRGSPEGYWIIDDEEDENPHLFSLKDSKQDISEVRQEIENLVIKDMEYYGKTDEEIEEKKKEMETYFEEEMPDLNDYADIIEAIETLTDRKDIKAIPYQETWETRAICFTEQEALDYKSRQKHNLGESQTYAMSPGYANYGHFLTLHKLIKGMRLLGTGEERELCKDAILSKLWRDKPYDLNIETVTRSTKKIIIKNVEKYGTEEEKNIRFLDTEGIIWSLYDLPVEELIKIRNDMFMD